MRLDPGAGEETTTDVNLLDLVDLGALQTLQDAFSAATGVLDPCVHVLEKPFDRSTLLRIVRGVLDEAD